MEKVPREGETAPPPPVLVSTASSPHPFASPERKTQGVEKGAVAVTFAALAFAFDFLSPPPEDEA